LGGLLVGLKFPVINQLYIKYQLDQFKSINTIYGHDLIGLALGPIVVIAFLLPAFGPNQTFIFLALINFFAFISLFFMRQYFEEG
jgi:predicted membrane-bound spermidine synthase